MFFFFFFFFCFFFGEVRGGGGGGVEKKINCTNVHEQQLCCFSGRIGDSVVLAQC